MNCSATAARPRRARADLAWSNQSVADVTCSCDGWPDERRIERAYALLAGICQGELGQGSDRVLSVFRKRRGPRKFLFDRVYFRRGSFGDGELRARDAAADVGSERGEERINARGKAADRGPLPCPEQHAGQFAVLIEDRSAGVALAGLDVEFDHLAREVFLRRVVSGAAAGGDAVLALTVAVDGKHVAGCGGYGRDADRLNRWPPDHECRQIPIAVDLERTGMGTEATRGRRLRPCLANRGRRANW